MSDLVIESKDVSIELELNSTKTAERILKILPLQQTIRKWGKEMIIETPLNLPLENATKKIEVGDVTYWPQGDSICIFFGPTPMSETEKPVPASNVNVIGKVKSSIEKLEEIEEGVKVTLKKQ